MHFLLVDLRTAWFYHGFGVFGIFPEFPGTQTQYLHGNLPKCNFSFPGFQRRVKSVEERYKGCLKGPGKCQKKNSFSKKEKINKTLT